MPEDEPPLAPEQPAAGARRSRVASHAAQFGRRTSSSAPSAYDGYASTSAIAAATGPVHYDTEPLRLMRGESEGSQSESAEEAGAESEGSEFDADEEARTARRQSSRGSGGGAGITLAQLEGHFHLGLKAAASQLGVCATTLKRACRRHGIKNWPNRHLKKLNRALQDVSQMESQLPGVGVDVSELPAVARTVRAGSSGRRWASGGRGGGASSLSARHAPPLHAPVPSQHTQQQQQAQARPSQPQQAAGSGFGSRQQQQQQQQQQQPPSPPAAAASVAQQLQGAPRLQPFPQQRSQLMQFTQQQAQLQQQHSTWLLHQPEQHSQLPQRQLQQPLPAEDPRVLAGWQIDQQYRQQLPSNSTPAAFAPSSSAFSWQQAALLGRAEPGSSGGATERTLTWRQQQQQQQQQQQAEMHSAENSSIVTLLQQQEYQAAQQQLQQPRQLQPLLHQPSPGQLPAAACMQQWERHLLQQQLAQQQMQEQQQIQQRQQQQWVPSLTTHGSFQSAGSAPPFERTSYLFQQAQQQQQQQQQEQLQRQQQSLLQQESLALQPQERLALQQEQQQQQPPPLQWQQTLQASPQLQQPGQQQPFDPPVVCAAADIVGSTALFGALFAPTPPPSDDLLQQAAEEFEAAPQQLQSHPPPLAGSSVSVPSYSKTHFGSRHGGTAEWSADALADMGPLNTPSSNSVQSKMRSGLPLLTAAEASAAAQLAVRPSSRLGMLPPRPPSRDRGGVPFGTVPGMVPVSVIQPGTYLPSATSAP